MTKPDTSIFLRATTAFFVAHALASAGSSLGIVELYESKIFLFAVVCLFPIAMGLCEIIARSNAFLDDRCDWIEKPAERLILQLSLCFFLCGFVVFILGVVSLTVLYGSSNITSSMIVIEAVIVACYCLAINLLHFARYLYHRSRETNRVLERDFPYYARLK